METATMDLTKKLDLRKQIVLDLKKIRGIENQKAQVVLALDFSFSMENLYKNGKVQDLVERILPLGLGFDDNGEVDFYLFESGVRKLPENITLSNIAGYINNKIIGKYQMGGTNYAPVINKIVAEFSQTKSGFMGMGKKQSATMDLPVYVIFITDGENSDHHEAERAIIEASKHGIFFQFVGIGNATFSFLKKLDNLSGRNIDNANFFRVQDLANRTDQELYQLLLTEFPSFITEAKSKNLIK
jgi:hypothetical protein